MLNPESAPANGAGEVVGAEQAPLAETQIGRRSPLGAAGMGLVLGASALTPGCALIASWDTPTDVTTWQDPTAPDMALNEKARIYQQRLEQNHLSPDGLLKYRRVGEEQVGNDYGNMADGCFHTGIYAASQALRYATTGENEAREQLRLALNGMRMLMEVTGSRGLLARHYSPVESQIDLSDKRWQKSTTHPEFIWRSDVSKDQYAGFIHGLGVTLAVVDDPEIRREVGELAAAAADHLIANDLTIVDYDGEETTYGDLNHRTLGIVPLGINSLISMAIIKVAAEATGEQRYAKYYDELIERGFSDTAYYAHFSLFGFGKRVNDNMAYLALYPLLLLEKDPEIRADFVAAERRSWDHLKRDRNAFISFIHAGEVGEIPEELDPGESPQGKGRRRGIVSLREFPEDKKEWPVDLTREGFEIDRAFLNSSDGLPRSEDPIPLYLRKRSSSMWASDPFAMAGNLKEKGDKETAAPDYLVAYWMGRYYGFIGAEE